MWISFHLHLVKWLIRHGRYTKVLSCRKGVDPPWLILNINRSRLMIVPLWIIVYQFPSLAVLAIKPVNTKISPLRIRHQHPVVRKRIWTPVQTTLVLAQLLIGLVVWRIPAIHTQHYPTLASCPASVGLHTGKQDVSIRRKRRIKVGTDVVGNLVYRRIYAWKLNT